MEEIRIQDGMCVYQGQESRKTMSMRSTSIRLQLFEVEKHVCKTYHYIGLLEISYAPRGDLIP